LVDRNARFLLKVARISKTLHHIKLYDIPKVVQNAYITEWFDTVGITIDVPRLGVDEIIIFSRNTFLVMREDMLDLSRIRLEMRPNLQNN
jgi:hypothetical protein